MAHPSRRRGFILLVVIGLLGALAIVAVTLSQKSHASRVITTHGIFDTKTFLVARSGIEMGKQLAGEPYIAGILPADPHPLSTAPRPYTLPVGESCVGVLHISDNNGAIHVNDGIAAGRSELKGLYQPDALDPWPSTGSQNISAWINLRLRRLLNAYGDIHRFADQQGWPQWESDGSSSFPPDYSFQSFSYPDSFQHSFTASGPRFSTLPPRRHDGSTCAPGQSCGLGDRVIAARPVRGYSSMEELKDILNIWGAEFLTAAYLQDTGFYEMIRDDLDVLAWSDTSFSRMTREFGKDADGDGHADFNSDVTLYTSQIPDNTVSLSTNPPDFSGIWQAHPVSPIHLNSASDEVRAAVLLAPTNVSVIEEKRSRNDNLQWTSGFVYGIQRGFVQEYSIGVTSLRNDSSNIRENGDGVGTQDSLLTQWLANKIIGVRDSMMVSQAYREIALSEGWPDSFDRLQWHFRRIMERSYKLENVKFSGSSQVVGSVPSHWGQDQWILEKLYPRILSCDRRFPSWMGAPLAMTQPVRPWSSLKIEDFVFRSPHPKVAFMPSGMLRLTARATLADGSQTATRTIRATLQAFETRILRDQASALSHTDPSSLTDVIIGPEVDTSLSHTSLLTVGLKDRTDVIPGGGVQATRYDFDGHLDEHGSSAFRRQNPATDPETIDTSNPGVAHEPPVNYPFTFQNYDPSLLAALRPPNAPSGTQTWRVPRDGWDIAQDHYLSLGAQFPALFAAYGLDPDDPSPANVNTLMTLLGMPANGDFDETAWAMFKSGTLSWNDWAPWGPNGPPVPPSGSNGHEELLNSDLEDSAASVFPGTSPDPCDLSPFGGLMFSPFHHGHPNTARFSDSFYFRPHSFLMAPSQRIGTWGNKGLVSVWVRIPTFCMTGGANATTEAFQGHVFHLQVWERVEGRYGPGAYSPSDQIIEKLRPVTISLSLRGYAHSGTITKGRVEARLIVGAGNSSRHDDLPSSGSIPWGGYVYDDWPGLSLIPFPTSQAEFDSNPLYTEMMFPWRRNTSSWWERFSLDDQNSAKEFGMLDKLRPASDQPYVFRPGSWARFTVRWDASQRIDADDMFQVVPHDLSGFDDTPIQATESMGLFNPKSMLSIGERHWESMPVGFNAGISGSYEYTPYGDLHPLERLNSQIDNLVIQFGGFPSNGFIPVEDGINDRSALYNAVESVSNFNSRRYPIDSGNEPFWLLDPNLDSGDLLVAIGATVHDVPFTPHYGDGTATDPWMTWPVKAPRVDIELIDGADVVAAVDRARPVDEYAITLNSREWASYGLTPGQGRHIRLQYRNEDTAGRVLDDVLTDIPWITSVWWRFVPSGGSRILDWQVD